LSFLCPCGQRIAMKALGCCGPCYDRDTIRCAFSADCANACSIKLYAINNLAVIGFSDCGEEGCLIFRSEFERLAIVGTYHSNPRALLKRCAVDYNLSFDYLSRNNSHLADFSRRHIVRPMQDTPVWSNR
jgi:hypothetical protein